MLNALALSGGLAIVGAAGVVTPASAQTYLHYTCAGGALFEAALFPGTRAAFVQVDGKSLQLPKRLSATGARYSRGGITLRIKGRAATLKRGGKTLNCIAN
jgi:membrane-bound inhibitor of C-type lysozyme